MTKTDHSFDTFFKNHLNPAQQKAVKHKNGPLLVVAGAGSGKTRVITARITHLILKQEVLPTSIIALTFTNKAATEMKQRIKQFLGDVPVMPFVGTFHSYCLQILKNHPHLLKHPTFSIMDDEDQIKLINRILGRFHKTKKTTARQVAHHISKIKNNVHSTTADDRLGIDPLVRQVYFAYEAEKEVSKCFDFDDLLLEVLKLFQSNKEFKASFQERIRHVLVDEYQDTNAVQHELLKQMALRKKQLAIDSLCAVGDEDQSIYSWRGATVANIMNFKKDFSDTTTVTIDQNYRSVQPILDAANHVIQHNQNRNPKSLWSEKQGSDRIRILSCLSGYQEADAVAAFLKQTARLTALNHVAILYRAHYQSRSLEEALIKQSIAYRIVGGIQFYERAEIKDLLAYLRLLVNPFDRLAFFRVINTPSRGLGEKFEELVYEAWNQQPFLSFTDACTALLESNKVTKAKKESLATFLSIFEGISHTNKPTQVLEQVIKKTDYFNYLVTSHDPDDAHAKMENVKELLHAVRHFEEQGLATVNAFLNEVALMQEKTSGTEHKQDQVQLMTLHAAKGLEFDTVILTGLEEGVLPSTHALYNPDGLEEERRLLYVGITRAQERLLITHARYRHTYGQTEQQLVSRFLNELPGALAIADDSSYWQGRQFEMYFSEWLNLKQHSIAPTIMTFGATVQPHPVRASKVSHRADSTPASSISTAQASAVRWKKNQPVTHKKFGIGLIKTVEQKSEDTVYLTVQFKTGTKKLDAKFVQPS